MLVGDVMVRGSLGHSGHEMLEFSILGEERSWGAGINKTLWTSRYRTLAY